LPISAASHFQQGENCKASMKRHGLKDTCDSPKILESCQNYCKGLATLRGSVDRQLATLTLKAFTDEPPELPGCAIGKDTFNTKCWTKVITDKGLCYSSNYSKLN